MKTLPVGSISRASGRGPSASNLPMQGGGSVFRRTIAAFLFALAVPLLVAPPVAPAASPLGQAYAALRTLREIRDTVVEVNREGGMNDEPGLKYLAELLFWSSNLDENAQPTDLQLMAFVRGALYGHAMSRSPGIWSSNAHLDDFVHKWEPATVVASLMRTVQSDAFVGDQQLEAFALGAVVHYFAELVTNPITREFAGGDFGETGVLFVPDYSLAAGLPIATATGEAYDPATQPGLNARFLLGPTISQVRDRHYFFESWATTWLFDTEGIVPDHPDGYEKDLDNYKVGSFTTSESILISRTFQDLYESYFGGLPDPAEGFSIFPDLLSMQLLAFEEGVEADPYTVNVSLESALIMTGLRWLWNVPRSDDAVRFAQSLGLLSDDLGNLPNRTLSALKTEAPERAVPVLEELAAVLRTGRASEMKLADTMLEDVNLYTGRLPKTARPTSVPDRRVHLETESASMLAALMRAPGRLMFHGLYNTGELVANVKEDIEVGNDPLWFRFSPRGDEAFVAMRNRRDVYRLFDAELSEPDPRNSPGSTDTDFGGQVMAMDYFPDGRTMAVALAGGELILYDTLADMELSRTPMYFLTGMYPVDLTINPDGSAVYVLYSPYANEVGSIQVVTVEEDPVVTTIPLSRGKRPKRIVYDPLEEKLIVLTEDMFDAFNTSATFLWVDPKTQSLVGTQSQVKTWNAEKNRVDSAYNWNWLVEKNSLPLMPINLMLCGFGAAALVACMVNLAIISTFQMITTPLLFYSMRQMHSAVYVQMRNDPLAVDYMLTGACLGLSMLGGGFGMFNFMLGFIAGQMCNFSADLRAQVTYVDVFGPWDIAVSTVEVPGEGPKIHAATMNFRSANIGIVTDQLKKQGRWPSPSFQAVTRNRIGDKFFGIASVKEREDRDTETAYGYAIAMDQTGTIVGALDVLNDKNRQRRVEFVTLKRPRLDDVLRDPRSYLPLDRLWVRNMRHGVTDVMTLSKRPGGDKLRYNSGIALYAYSLTFNIPFGGEREFLNTNMEQNIPAYDAEVERIIADAEGESEFTGGSQRIHALASRPTFVLTQTNLFGDPVSGGVVFEVEGRRPMTGVELYLWPKGQRRPAYPVGEHLYHQAFRDGERRLLRIVIPNLELLPGMQTAEEFQARVDVKHTVGGKDIKTHLYAYGATSTELDLVGTTLRLEVVDVNNGLMRDQFHSPSGGAPGYHALTLPLGRIDFEGGTVQQPSRVVCDGVSMLLLRAKAPAEGSVTFRVLPGDRRQVGVGRVGGHQNGELRELDRATGMRRVNEYNFQFGPAAEDDTVTVETVYTGGEYWAFALFTPPEDFARYDPNTLFVMEQDRELSDRSLTFTAAFEPEDPDELPANGGANVMLSRKPLVFVHDVGCGPNAWDEFGSLARGSGDHPGYPDSLRKYIDYQATSMGCFEQNKARVAQQTLEYVGSLRERGYAIARVDMITHGSAAVLGRIWVAGEMDDASLKYRQDKNFSQGAIHRLLTLGATFQGVPAGNFALGFLARTSLEARDLISEVALSPLGTPLGAETVSQTFFTRFLEAMMAGEPGVSGAVQDVSVWRPQNDRLEKARVKAHAIAAAGSIGTSEETAMGMIGRDGLYDLWQILALPFQTEIQNDHVWRMKMQPVINLHGQVIHLIDRFQAMGNGWRFAPEEHSDWSAWGSQTGRLPLHHTSLVRQSHFKSLESGPSPVLPPVMPVNKNSYQTFASGALAVISTLDQPMEAEVFADELPDLTLSDYWGNPSNFVRTQVGIPSSLTGCAFPRPSAAIQPEGPLAAFLAPLGAGTVAPGGTMAVQVVLGAGLSEQVVVLVTPFGLYPLPTDESVAQIPVPSGFSGSFTMGVLIVTTEGEVYAGPTVSMSFPASGAPHRLLTGASTVHLLGPGDIGQVETILSSPEGDRRAAPGDPSVTYVTSSPTVVTVDDSGTLYAVAPGHAVVTVQSGTLATEVHVKVGKSSLLEPLSTP